MVGRKTGLPIKGAPRNSKGYEDIDAFYGSPTNTEASTRTNRRASMAATTYDDDTPTATRSRRLSSIQPEYEMIQDDYTAFDQEESMELEQDSALTPRTYMANATLKTNAPSPKRPSPRRASLFHRDASLSDQDVIDVDNQEQSDSDVQVSPPSKKSTARMVVASDSDEPIEHVPSHFNASRRSAFAPQPGSNSRTSKGKGRQQESDEDDDDHDDVPNGHSYDYGLDLDTTAGGDYDDDDDLDPGPNLSFLEPIQEDSNEDSDVDKTPKKAKSKPTSSPSGTKSRKRKWESVEPTGVRRSSREHIKPLEFWRNERIVYSRRQSGPQPHYGIKEIIRLPKEEPKAYKRSRSRSVGPGGSVHGGTVSQKSRLKRIKEEEEEGSVDYTGWDDSTDPEGLVWDYIKHEEVKRRIAFTSNMIQTKPASNKSANSYRFQKVFADGEYMAGGVLEIPVNEKKPLKPARDNTFMMYCSRGAVRVLVYRTTFTIAKGGFFLVPRGNSYEIENIGTGDAQIVFMQAREIRITEDIEE